MKHTIQIEAPSYLTIAVFQLDKDHYQSAQEFIKLHGHAPWIQDIPKYNDINHQRFHFVEESEHINIKIIDENSLTVSEFKLYDLDHLPLTWAENEITHDVNYFWKKYGDNKPCLICRLYHDIDGYVLWEHEIEVEDMPKKKDFGFKTVGVDVRDHFYGLDTDSFWNCLERDKSIFYKQNPIKVTYSPAVSELSEIEFLDCFLLDSKGEILKDFYGRY